MDMLTGNADTGQEGTTQVGVTESPAEPIEKAFLAALAALSEARLRAKKLADSAPPDCEVFAYAVTPTQGAERELAENAAYAVIALAHRMLSLPNASLPELRCSDIAAYNSILSKAPFNTRAEQQAWATFSPTAAYAELVERFDPETVLSTARLQSATTLMHAFAMQSRELVREACIHKRGAIELKIFVSLDYSSGRLPWYSADELAKIGAALTAFGKDRLNPDEGALIEHGETIWRQWARDQSRKVTSRETFEVGAGITLTTFRHGHWILRTPEVIGEALLLFLAEFGPAT
jgi:hypothetical protein